MTDASALGRDASTAQTRVSLGPGRPAVGFDVGGTLIKAGAVDADGTLSPVLRVPTPAQGDATVDALLSVLAGLLEQFPARDGTSPEAVGLAVPGIVDERRGVAVLSENLGWRDVELRSLAEERLGLPVALVHDVRAGARAERELGAARDYASVVTVIVGTGVSAAVVVDGHEVVSGGFAGEIGHAPFGPPGVLCGCGATGCLEATASAGGMLLRYESATGQRLRGADELIDLAEAGDATAASIWGDALDALGRALAATTALLGPDAIVLGGGVAAAGARLREPLEAALATHLRYHRLPRLETAQLGADAGLVGALLSARG